MRSFVSHVIAVLSRPLAATLAAVALLAAETAPRTAPAQAERAQAVNRPPLPGAPTTVTAFVDVSVIPMDRERILAHQTVLVQSGWITAMGPSSQVHVPSGARRIDGRGKYLIPGLADMHIHLLQNTHGDPEQSESPDSKRAARRLLFYVANGVTTVRNMDRARSDYGDTALMLKARAAAGEIVSPRMYTAGPWGPETYIGVAVSTSNDPMPLAPIATYVERYKAAGYDFVKSYDEPSPVIYDSMAAAAHRIGLPIAGHIARGVSFAHALATMKSIEHLVAEYSVTGLTEQTTDTALMRAVAVAMQRAGVWNCPTQAHYDRRHKSPRTPLLKILHETGVGILLGTDDLPRKGAIARELEAMVSHGLTPFDALLTGTRNVAAYFGTLDSSGTVTPGKRGDLVLLKANPLQDVGNVALMTGVMVAGRWYTSEELDQMLTASKPSDPPKSYWYYVAEELGEVLPSIFDGIDMNETQYKAIQRLGPVYDAERQALADSLVSVAQATEGYKRMRQQIDRQLGEYETILPADQRPMLEKKVDAWMKQHAPF